MTEPLALLTSERSARAYFLAISGGPCCPRCGEREPYRLSTGRLRCQLLCLHVLRLSRNDSWAHPAAATHHGPSALPLHSRRAIVPGAPLHGREPQDDAAHLHALS